ncbi:MAG: protein kinase [Polyangiaceae bacterium]|nr:protein kinase [Polyangiaceae bacterium]
MSSGLPLDRRVGERFVVEKEVGRGGAGIVYRAFDLVTGGYTALKVIDAEFGTAVAEESALAREGKLLSELDHPAIVKTIAYGFFEETGRPFIAMEWLEGEDLARRQKRDPLSMRQAIQLTLLVADALEYAHEAGVIHQDIKPGNIFLCSTPQPALDLDFFPKLVDFGVAAARGIQVTQAGDVVGTPAYMAPEQARCDGSVDARSDIYSLGATLFELISGRPPHVGPTAIATLARLVTTPPPRLSELRSGVSPKLDDLVSQMLSTERAERPGSIREVAEVLLEILSEEGQISWVDVSDPGVSTRLGSGASRLITSIVALGFDKASSRERALEHLRQRTATAVPLGQQSIVAHLGVELAVGNEAHVALELARRLARSGARVGVASGRARLNWASPHGRVLPVGEVVDRAAALARDAEPGTAVADVTTSELGRGRYEFRARDDGSALVGEPARGPRTTSGAPFVGRDPELAQILSAFERTTSDCTPVLVTVTGPPGIGKTRLRREVLSRMAAHAHAPHVILQRSEAYARGHALGAAADVLRAIIDLPKGASPDEAESAIVARLGPATRSELTTANREVLSRLLANEPLPPGADPRGARDVLWLAMTDLVLQFIHKQPTAIVMEDLQWADPESIGWLDHMLGRATSQPLLVMGLIRPGFWGDHGARFAGRDHVRVELRPISKRSTRNIVRSLLGENASETLVEVIAERSSGLPLFAEELARLASTGESTALPPTIEAAIQASLDTLDEECRDALGRVSVLGLTCWDSALEALGMPHSEGLMSALASAEALVEQNGSRFSGPREWVFKHALVRDVAYGALGERERQELHALAAHWLASMGEDAAVVAGHFDLGGQHEAAARHWARAAERALATNALSDAVKMAERALTFAYDKPSGFQRASYLDEAWSRLDPRAADRETAILALEENVYDEPSAVLASGARARFDDARGTGIDIDERLADARDNAARLHLHAEEARCSAVLASRFAFAGKFTEANIEVRRLLTLAESNQLKSAAVDAYQAQAIVRQSQGALSAALEARRNAVVAARGASLKEREAMLTTNLGFALTTIGARQEARAALEAGLALADAIGSGGAVRHAQMNLLGWTATFGSDRRLDAHLADARADADASASGVWAPPDRANLGILFYRGCELLRAHAEGANHRALALLKMAAEAYRAMGHRDVLPVALSMWAEAELRHDRVAQAQALASEAAELVDQGAASLLNESQVYLVLHNALLRQEQPEAARLAVQRGMQPLVKRVHGLAGTAYARLFLTELPSNAALLAAAEGYGLIPDEIQRHLEGR